MSYQPTPGPWVQHTFADLGYVARLRAGDMVGGAGDSPPYYVEFELFHIVGTDVPDGESVLMFERRGDDGGALDFYTSSLDEAQRYAAGMTKWDGCSNVDLMPDADTMWHTCGGSDDLKALGEALGRVYDLATEMMPAHRRYR